MEVAELEPEPVLDGPPPLGPEDSCDCNPEFAVICSFIKQFGDRVDLELDIEQLKSGLENQESLDEYLIETHVKLLKKLRRYFVRDQWEKVLIRFAYEYSYEHGREIELVGYLKARPSTKLQLLRRLLDAQFECDQKFKALVNNDEAAVLRNQPLGRDIQGNIYWHCEDKEGNLRVYSEQPLDHKSWRILCKDFSQLDDLIVELDKTKNDKIKGDPPTEPYNPYPEIFPEYFIKSEGEEVDENHKEDLAETRVPSRKPAKKGRRGCTAKKSSPVASPPEVEDIKLEVPVKPETNIDNNRTIIEPKLEETDRLGQTTSIESQVKQTLDNLISKVATSFDFFFRWNNPDVKRETKEPAKKSRKRNSKRDPVQHEELPRRSSSRIQQLQQRKITEYVEKTVQEKCPINEIKVPKTTRTTREEVKLTNINPKPSKPAKKNRQRWRTKGKKKLSWDKDDSDLSSPSSLTDSNDESFVEELNGAMNPETINDSDEFACEDEETNDAPVILKRVRTARQKVDIEEDGQLCEDSVAEEDKPCGRCDKSHDPDWILLCDICDDGYHTACCIPPLMFVPDGDWFCLPCEHKALLSRLTAIASSIKEVLAEKERERLKRQKLRQAFKKAVIKPANDEIVPQKRNRAKLPDLNPPNAVQDLDEILGESSGQELSDSYRERAYRRPKKKKKVKPKPARSKRRRREITDDEEDEFENYNVSRSTKKTYSRRNLTDSEIGEDLPSSAASDDDSQPKARKARACVSYRYQEYDELIQSAIRADSDDPASADDDDHPDEEPSNYGRGKDMATIEAIAYQQENGISQNDVSIEQVKSESKDPAISGKTKKKGRRLNDLDAESEMDIATSDDSFQAASETEEEEEEDDVTEIDSEDESSIDEIVHVKQSKSRNISRKKKKKKRNDYYESDESDDYEPRTRRNASKKVSYKESTDEDDEEFLNQPGQKKKGLVFSDEETDASWHSSANSPGTREQVEHAQTDIDGKSSPEVDSRGELSPEVSPPITTSLETGDKPDDTVVSSSVGDQLEIERSAPVAKKIRLEKRETRPVFTANPLPSLNESIDEIAAPLYEPKQSTKSLSKSKTKSTSGPRPTNSRTSNTIIQPSVQQVETQPHIAPIVQTIPPLSTLPVQAPIGMPTHPSLPPQPHSHYHPAYSQPIYPTHGQYPRPQYYLPPMYPHPAPHFAPGPMPYMMGPASAGGSISQPPPIRSSIDELNQYCNRSPYPGNLFNSFNVSHSPKNLPVPNPPFYREDEVRPPTNTTGNNNKQKSW